jgi:hypothetical protein
MDEHEPVEDSEFVYRRIPGVFFDAGLPVPVQREAFRPNANDTNGLSVFRACFAQPTDTLFNLDPTRAKDYYVARISVRSLRDLGLSVTPDPLPGGPVGHAVLPELNWAAYRAQKEIWKAILLELAKLASADIVHRPSST